MPDPARPSRAAPPRWSRASFAHPADHLARALLGCTLVRLIKGDEPLRARIVETEAYLGIADKACHSFAGRRTPRVEPMYGPPGTAYVYSTYGMHHCLNIVCGKVGEPIAVLLRAAEPISGLPAMRRHRAARSFATLPDRDLCRGPGRLCLAFALTSADSGRDFSTDPALFIEPPPRGLSRGPVLVGPRVGIAGAEEWTTAPLRFALADSRSVSRPNVRPVSGPSKPRSSRPKA
ncbi:MAG: DNA-3-methyladenine glycosylase [Phycisphaerales bacterium]